jgi:thiol:disulfide interchange protein
MMGVFDIDLAAKFRINPGKLQCSKNMLALFMGAISAILAGACIAPVVISALIFAARIGWYGFFVPMALGIGMALPWPIVGAGLSILPKPGKFMTALKYVFAIIIFAAGAYYAYLGIKLLPDEETSVTGDGFAALEAAKKESLRSGKPILIRFTASWCKNCHAMERTTLQDDEVKKYIDENYIQVTFPAEDPTKPKVKALLTEYEVPGFPAFVILQNSKK